MDRQYIDDNHIVARYLADELPDGEREAFEAYYLGHPEVVQEMEAAARFKVGLMQLRDAGELEALMTPRWRHRERGPENERDMKSVGLLIVHGMGDTRPDFYKELTEPMRKRLQSDWDRVAWRAVFYQSELQGNQAAVLRKIRPQVRWEGLRELMLYGFSDAASLDHRKELPGSPYYRVQKLILEALDELHEEVGLADAPVAIVAQSLGGHVISNYIWDAQQPIAFAGIWNGALNDGVPTGSPRDRFRRLQTLQRFLTTGCNIPVFVAGHAVIEPIDRALLGRDFRWINQFDPDDALGWPLQQLGSAYEALVEDAPVNAGGDSLLGALKAFTPYSHVQYWTTRKVLDRIAAAIRELLP